jgi:exo-beta-1,3-glucanase (GH17 family)
MKAALTVAAMAFVVASCSPSSGNKMSPTKVEIVRTETGYQLLRGGEPYEIRGAGMGRDDIARFASHGGNSIRTWSTLDDEQDTMALLDAAHEHGVTVAIGLPMRAERHGFDYNDPDAVAAQFELIRGEVLKYRDHPAVLAWLVGNELNHHYTNPAVYDAVNDVARMIHELDPNHPVSSTMSGRHADVIAEIAARAPELDFLSFQLYGGLFGLPQFVDEYDLDMPFMVTEWGAIGYWEMEQTSWGIPTEMNSSDKAGIFERGYREILQPLQSRGLIGDYVFLWGQKQERTPTWFGMFTRAGYATEVVDVMERIWTGAEPENRAPRVQSLKLDGKIAKESVILRSGQVYDAAIDVVDPDGDELTYRWELKPESTSSASGGDFEAAINNIEGQLATTDEATTQLTAPAAGQYRLFVYAYDGQGHAAHANIPFLVEPNLVQSEDALIAGETMAVAYSGFREGQHPDRGSGAANPSRAEILEDLEILVAHDLRLVRMYDTEQNTRTTLELIREHDLPVKVLLGIWLRAEISNHEGCPWLDEPIPDDALLANRSRNDGQVQAGIELANEFKGIVVAVNVGNEALVDWNDHMMSLDRVIEMVRLVKASIGQPVTVADNYEWWIRDGAPLAAEVDFIGVHTYPVWENKDIDAALDYTIDNIRRVRTALPDKPIAILEAGWATSATEFGERANQPDQARYFAEMSAWSEETNTTVFFFEAFDEPWKGDEYNPLGAEKHWGLFFVDRTPKQVMER